MFKKLTASRIVSNFLSTL